jgi:hypothetical protein
MCVSLFPRLAPLVFFTTILYPPTRTHTHPRDPFFILASRGASSPRCPAFYATTAALPPQGQSCAACCSAPPPVAPSTLHSVPRRLTPSLYAPRCRPCPSASCRLLPNPSAPAVAGWAPRHHGSARQFSCSKALMGPLPAEHDCPYGGGSEALP